MKTNKKEQPKPRFDEDLEDDNYRFESVNLGLDTLHFRFEQGNLLIRQKFDELLRRLNTVENAVVA